MCFTDVFLYFCLFKCKSNKIMLSFIDMCSVSIACCSLHSSKQQQSSQVIMCLYYGKCILCSAIEQVLLKLVYSLCRSIDASKLPAVKFGHCRPLKYFHWFAQVIFPAQHVCLRPNFNCQAQQLANIFHLLGGSLDTFLIWAFMNLVGSALY